MWRRPTAPVTRVALHDMVTGRAERSVDITLSCRSTHM